MMNTSWSKLTKYLFGVGLVLLGIYILNLSRPVIPLLAMAALIAVIVRPVILWLHLRLHLSRSLAVGLVYLSMVLLVPLALLLILPMIIDALVYVKNLNYQGTLQSGVEWLRSTLITIKAVQLPVAGLDAYVDRSIDTLLKGFQTFSPPAAVPPSLNASLQSLISTLMSVMKASAGLVGVVFVQVAKITFIFLASIYISLDAHTYRGALLQAVPAAYQTEISILLTRIGRLWNAYFFGQLILIFIFGGMITISLAALGVPGALYLGIIAGLLEIIPNIGVIIATIPALIVALLQGSISLPINHLYLAGLIILLYTLVPRVKNDLIVPRVMGAAVKLPPVIVMAGVVVGASAGGVLGALLATPVIATGREVLHYIYLKIQGQEPIQFEETAQESGTIHFGNKLSSLIAGFQKLIRSRLSESRRGSGEE